VVPCTPNRIGVQYFSSTTVMPMEEKLLNDRYRLIEVIGSGGMAMVYRGIDTLLHRPVAIKILREAYSSDPAFLERFQREARSAARLDHPNVVTVYDVGRDDGQHYIVMEFVEGEDLKTLIRRRGKLGIDQAVGIAVQVAAGVGHAHKAGIIHCDIKPHNVLITRSGTAKVTDFGIARALSASGMTDPEMIWGSPLYFSPEQAAGERPTPASDVYSIGVTLYEMLTGTPPFEAEKPAALALMHMRDEPPPPTVHNPQVPPQLEWIVRKVLAKEPSARYRTAEQLALVLQEYSTRGDQATSLFPASSGEMASLAEAFGGRRQESEAVDKGERPGLDWRTWALGAAAFIAVVGLIPLWAVVYRAGTQALETPGVPTFATAVPTAAMVTVPDVQGQHWEEARDGLEALGLRFTLEELAGASEPEGTIVRQEPAPGETVESESEIRLFISGPPEMVEVPGVLDAPVEMARTWIEQSGLQAVILDPVWDTRPVSTVIEQEPERGIELQAGSLVTLTVSGGTAVPIRVDANLANVIMLDEVELLESSFRPGETVLLSLHWRSLASVNTSYSVFVHLIGPSGSLVSQDDREPVDGLQPTSDWVPGLRLWDLRQIYIPPSAPSGRYQVRTGMYVPGSDRLTVVDPGQVSVEQDSLLIAEIEISRP